MKNWESFRWYYKLYQTLFINLAMTVWLIYGNVIFYSSANDCQTIEATYGLWIMMLVFLIIGYFFLLAMIIVLIVLPFILFCNRRREEQGEEEINDEQMLKIANSLHREKWDPLVHKHEHECKICLAEYKNEDNVTKLKCHPTHYFHTDCIETWVKIGKN